MKKRPAATGLYHAHAITQVNPCDGREAELRSSARPWPLTLLPFSPLPSLPPWMAAWRHGRHLKPQMVAFYGATDPRTGGATTTPPPPPPP